MSSVQKIRDVPTGSCSFYIERKRRFCRFHPAKNNKYCAEHLGLLGVESERKRVKCPLNEKHTCYEDQLDKHLKKCKKQQKETPIYYVEGINGGSLEIQGPDKELGKISWADIPLEELKDIIQKVKDKYKEHVTDIDREIFTHPCLAEELGQEAYGIPALRHRKQQASLIGHLDNIGLLSDGLCYVEMGAGKGMLSHWIQKALRDCTKTNFILVDRGHVRYKADNQHKWDEEGPKFERIRIDISNLNLGQVPSIASSDRPVVAVGKHLCGCATDLALRCLTQTLEEEKDSASNSSQCEPECKKSRLEDPVGVVNEEKQHMKRSKFAGLTVALCCHHRCDWKSYVGKQFMTDCGFCPRDFALLCKLSGWAAATWQGWTTVKEMTAETQVNTKQEENEQTDTTSVAKTEDGVKSENQEFKTEGHSKSHVSIARTADEDTQSDDEAHKPSSSLTRHDLKIGPEEREKIGRMCKRLIDFGRVSYLRKCDLDCRLSEYIEQKLTPENVAIIAKPKIQVK